VYISISYSCIKTQQLEFLSIFLFMVGFQIDVTAPTTHPVSFLFFSFPKRPSKFPTKFLCCELVIPQNNFMGYYTLIGWQCVLLNK
jgi:hypothetical protein